MKGLKDWTENERQYVLQRILRDVLLVAGFVFQHNFLARDCWKRTLLRLNIYVSERLLYVITTCLALSALINKWASTPDVMLWAINVDKRPVAWAAFLVLHVVCWAIILGQLRMMDPLELMGVQQVYYYYKNMSAPMSYKQQNLRLFYQHMRLGGTTCLWLMLWVHPIMTLDRLLLAVLFSCYMPLAQRVTQSDYKFSCCYFPKASSTPAITTTTTTTTKRRRQMDY
ncbi:hypothetical protein ACOMHN_062410 [Nucella lapillus]